jgi:hypothetical protein
MTENAYVNPSSPDKNDVVSYKYRLFVSMSPEVDDLTVSWMTSSTQTQPDEWSLTGDGPGPGDEHYCELKAISGTITSASSAK